MVYNNTFQDFEFTLNNFRSKFISPVFIKEKDFFYTKQIINQNNYKHYIQENYITKLKHEQYLYDYYYSSFHFISF